MRREVGDQPVQPMESCQRDLRPALLDGELGGLEQRRGKLGGAREQFGALLVGHLREERLQELAHDAERERSLEFGAARAQYLETRLLAPYPRLADQRSLANSRWTLNRQYTAAG